MSNTQQKYFVELTNAENQLMKAAFMAVQGFVTKDQTAVILGAGAFAAFASGLGPDGLKAFITKMDAHADQSANDGTTSAVQAAVEGR
jgi:soluble cytochrome b562